MKTTLPLKNNRIPFSELVDYVRKSDVADKLHGMPPFAEHIKVPEVSKKPFVEPDFDIDSTELNRSAKVLAISAPAAVGKSSLAEQLARVTRNLVWDLSHFKVGSGFFTGTLVDTFGTSGLEAVREALRSGRATLILDAADEALVGAGSKNFEAAISNLVSLISDEYGLGPAVIVLGRPDTIDDINRLLAERSVEVQHARVSFFNENQAREFVKVKAEKPERRGIASAEIDQFLDRFFEIVGSALGGVNWESTEAFLGYAPVLDALGAFYKDEDNPMRKLNEINQSESSAHVWDLLIEIIESVLDREKEKFAKTFGGSNSKKVDFGLSSYSKENQINLLLSDTPDDTEIDVQIDDGVDESWFFEELMPQVRAQYREHPFLNGSTNEPNPLLRFASTAFRDYAVAHAVNNKNDFEISRLLDYWLDPRVTPSPMLSRFCMSAPLDIKSVSPEAITMISDSHATGFQENVRLEIEIHEGADSEQCETNVEVTLFEGRDLVRQIEATLKTDESLRLARSIARTSIQCPRHTVVTGSGFQDFSIGPDVSIRSEQLDSESPGVRVVAIEDRPNEISTTRVLGSTRRVSSPRPNALRIVVPLAVFPWQLFKSKTTENDVDSESSIYWAGMEFRRNIKWFAKGSGGAGLSYPVGALEAILAKGRASQEALDFCIQLGVVVKRHEYWEMKLPDFSPTTVFDNDISDDSYRSFLKEFVAWQQAHPNGFIR